jgi:hypothetical protein
MLAQAQPSTLDLIPGARNAVNFLLSKVAEFQRVPQRLAAVQTNLINIKRVAESRGKIGYATEAAYAISSVMNLQTQHQKASGSVANALDQLRTSGLLNGVVDVAVSVIDAASKVTSILSGTASMEKMATSLASKVMSQEEQAALTKPGGSSPMLTYLLYGGLLYVGLWALRKSGGTRKW